MTGAFDDDPDSRPGEQTENPGDGAGPRLRYAPNPKHKEPWQRGRRGSMCPTDISEEQAQQLLTGSELVGEKRYAVHDGRPYCAQDDGIGNWHGYPVGWKEVPSALRTKWVKKEKRVKKRDIDRYWEG